VDIDDGGIDYSTEYVNESREEWLNSNLIQPHMAQKPEEWLKFTNLPYSLKRGRYYGLGPFGTTKTEIEKKFDN